MSNGNGTRLARQVRRFIEEHPASASLQNVEQEAKEIILELGDPKYFEDESERIELIPLEWTAVKKSFESKYKKLQKEYPNLPDLKGKATTQIENTNKKAEDEAKKKAEEEARKAREAAEDEAKKKADNEAKTSALLDQLKSIDPKKL
jgi:membrane protein involved in colicin uptake